MHGAISWETITAVAGTVSALLGPPLGVVVFYIRAIRDDQRATHAELRDQVGRLDADVQRLERAVGEVQRVYTTKDEWIRESMRARQQLERLSEVLARLGADVENVRGMVGQFGRAVTAIVELADRLTSRA